ncbi:hypothetical protein Tsubulata_036926 [Turnera subulata]|uniref:PAS domain-containing protein n=1 Tax=Turnera subulata TaxID=218843 RepID=A0A9Q0FDU6_9ROSI|nr:hypothetical protein Tsubulata_036926 [Turnera subulata]
MNNIVGVCFVGHDATGQKVVMDKFINNIQGDYKAIVHSPNPLIPPIFASDGNTCCVDWNTAMEKLTGWPRGEINHWKDVGRLAHLASGGAVADGSEARIGQRGGEGSGDTKRRRQAVGRRDASSSDRAPRRWRWRRLRVGVGATRAAAAGPVVLQRRSAV